MSPQSWAYTGGPRSLTGADAANILIEGSTFCVATDNGDITGTGPHGLFFRDLRSLSRWELRVDGYPLEPLASHREHPHAATYITRVPPPAGRADSHLLVLRHRHLGDGMRDDVVVRNLGAETAACEVTLLVDADFADLFEVKENRVVAHPERVTTSAATDASGVHFGYHWLGHSRDVHITCASLALTAPGLLTMFAVIPPREEWRTCLEVRLACDNVAVEPRYRRDPADAQEPPRDERGGPPVAIGIATPHVVLAGAIDRAQRDIAALRIPDPDDATSHTVAAGAPWFMTLFGRDSLLTASMSLPFAPSIAAGTLRTLARLQGVRVDPLTEEQPGRILHEMRFGTAAGLALGGGQAYYGTADATPLFVMLLGEAHDWGLPADEIALLVPHADAALDWITTYGDRDGDGFVEYQRATDRGLVNQGWKDSFDAVNFADGHLAAAPLALCEVQGYAYAAFRARSRIAADSGDAATAAHWAARAEELKQAFNDAFWLDDRGYYAVALDRDKKPVDALASNMGHCLWTGIVAEDRAAAVAEKLLSPDMFSGWGVRTLAASMGAFNPLSYHNGSVWPHDNAIIVAGLVRYGFIDEAHRVARAILEAAAAFGLRLPELWSGFDRSEFPAPVPYPTSCSPQAWAAAAPLSILRTLLRFEPRLPVGRVDLAPVMPAEFLPLMLEHLQVGPHEVRLDVDAAGAGRLTGITTVGEARR